jgi:hypothetical protein
MSKNPRFVGRVSVCSEPSIAGPYIRHTIYIRAKVEEDLESRITLRAQSDAEDEDYAYGLEFDSSLGFGEYVFQDTLKLLSTLHRAMLKIDAPRARLLSGKAILSHCQLAQILTASEKLGFHVSRFQTRAEALDWANDWRKELPTTNSVSEGIAH